MASSSYEKVLEALKAACAAVTKEDAALKYYVRRGPINWYHFRWDKHAYGCSILDTDSDLDDSVGLHEAILQVQLMTRLPEEESGTDENEIYALRQDAKAIVNALRTAKVDGRPGEAVTQKVIKPRVALAYDVDAGAQGVIVTFTAGYFQAP